MLDKGKPVPNWNLVDHEGRSHALWNFRQKSHVVLLYDPEARKEQVERWQAAIRIDHKQWDWLNTAIVVVKEAPKEMVPGIYAIDRYGSFLNFFPLDHWSFDDLEREYLYYEARHC